MNLRAIAWSHHPPRYTHDHLVRVVDGKDEPTTLCGLQIPRVVFSYETGGEPCQRCERLKRLYAGNEQ